MIKEDLVLSRIYKAVGEDMAALGLPISAECIRDIHNIQSEIIRLGMEGCDKIVCPALGTFKIKKKTKFVYDLQKEHGEDTELTRRIDSPLKRVYFK